MVTVFIVGTMVFVVVVLAVVAAPLIAVRICAVFFGAHSVVEYYRGCTVGVKFRVMITLRVRVLVRVQASAWVTSRGRSRFRVSKVLGQSQGHG